MTRKSSTRVAEVVVLTTAMLTFISFWRAAAVVLCDMASTVFYIEGIAERVVGPSAPWFVLGVMLFSGLVSLVYVESCTLFIRGGVYRAVKEAFGAPLAKASVSSILFDYVLTGPISSISAGHYLAGLLNGFLPSLHVPWTLDPASFSVAFAAAVTLYFWRKNIIGIHESSEKSLRIMQLMTFTMGLLLLWSLATVALRRPALPPFELHLKPESLGWLEGADWVRVSALAGLTIAFGHSILGMSGLESMAQVYREVEAPKLPNLKRTALIIFFFCLLSTGVTGLLAAMIVPEAERLAQADNLLSALSLNLAGPPEAKLAMQVLVVATGALILSGAVNTAVVGASSVLARVAEDGILDDWFRRLHPVYGTNYRMINLVVGLQLLTILASRGNVFYLGEAYAFGVVWSFVFKSLAIVVLRFRDPRPREWAVPLNLKLGRIQFPVGVLLIFLVLLGAGTANLLTKKVATISGVAFTAAFYAVFTVSERRQRAHKAHGAHKEKLNLRHESQVSHAFQGLRRGRRVLVAVRSPDNLYHLRRVLEAEDDEKTDIVVLNAKVMAGEALAGERAEMGPEEEHLFTRVVETAERFGQRVHPVLLVSNDPAYALAQAAHAVQADEAVMGLSTKFGPEVQMERFAMAWGALIEREGAQRPLHARILWADGKELSFPLT